jgi:hypothetical protein
MILISSNIPLQASPDRRSPDSPHKRNPRKATPRTPPTQRANATEPNPPSDAGDPSRPFSADRETRCLAGRAPDVRGIVVPTSPTSYSQNDSDESRDQPMIADHRSSPNSLNPGNFGPGVRRE